MKDIRVFTVLFLPLFCRLEILPNERLKKRRGNSERRQQRRKAACERMSQTPSPSTPDTWQDRLLSSWKPWLAFKTALLCRVHHLQTGLAEWFRVMKFVKKYTPGRTSHHPVIVILLQGCSLNMWSPRNQDTHTIQASEQSCSNSNLYQITYRSLGFQKVRGSDF